VNKIAIITDSIACLPPELVREYGIYIVPVKLVLDGKVYTDGVDLTIDQAYELLKQAKVATTSAPSPGDFLAAFIEARKEADNLLCIAVSSELSTLYFAAREAKEILAKECPEIHIEVLDTRTAAAAEGLIVLAAARLSHQGRTLKEIIEEVEGLKNKVETFFLLDTLRYLHRTGRIPHIASQLGSLLPVKPILTIKDGKVALLTLSRNRRVGLEKMMDLVKERVGQKPVHIAVTHAGALEEGLKLRERIAAEFNCVELLFTDFTPVMGYAVGPGLLGLAFYAED